MSVWFDVLSGTRHWELEPYFDVDGGRALALEDTEYLVYIEKPGPLEMKVEKHGYDVFWIDPATGETVRKKFSGDHFTGAPPDPSHDWVLHVVREGTLQSMNRSYKFESRDIVLQELEANPQKIPYDFDEPAGDLSIAKPSPFAVKADAADARHAHHDVSVDRRSHGRPSRLSRAGHGRARDDAAHIASGD